MEHEPSGSSPSPTHLHSNTLALIGMILTAVAGLMCVWLFIAAGGVQLPPADGTGQQDAESESDADPAAIYRLRMRLLLLGSAAAVLNLVGLCLSVAGLLVPNRPRFPAFVATVLSLLLFAGIFGVLAVGTLLEGMPPENQAVIRGNAPRIRAPRKMPRVFPSMSSTSHVRSGIFACSDGRTPGVSESSPFDSAV